jgi:hypothetical protein
MGIDPFGLFQFNLAAQWSMVDEVPGSGNKYLNLGGVPLGATGAFVSARCSCKEECGSWKLSECSAFFLLDVLIRADLRPDAESWTRDREAEHVFDLRSAEERMRQAGTAAERAMQQQTFASKAECEARSKRAIIDAIKSISVPTWNQSRTRDTNGSHSYPGLWPFQVRRGNGDHCQ